MGVQRMRLHPVLDRLCYQVEEPITIVIVQNKFEQ